jgi:ubiquinone biosynthesis protein
MRLRPELILLQKTMVSVEGVARRLNPDHDLWAAARPVVERWIRRELGPQAQVRDALEEVVTGLRALSHRIRREADDTAAAPVMVVPRASPWPMVLSLAALAMATTALVLSF